jgi:hypothetical protein
MIIGITTARSTLTWLKSLELHSSRCTWHALPMSLPCDTHDTSVLAVKHRRRVVAVEAPDDLASRVVVMATTGPDATTVPPLLSVCIVADFVAGLYSRRQLLLPGGTAGQ